MPTRIAILLWVLAGCSSSNTLADAAQPGGADSGVPATVGARLATACNLAPDEECVYDLGSACHASASLDLAAARSYQAALKMLDASAPALPSGVQITGATVRIEDTANNTIPFSDNLPNPFAVATSGFVPGGGEAVIPLTPLPIGYGDFLFDQEVDRLLGTIVLAITVKGHTGSDEALESEVHRIPLALTTGSQACSPDGAPSCTPGQDGEPPPPCL